MQVELSPPSRLFFFIYNLANPGVFDLGRPMLNWIFSLEEECGESYQPDLRRVAPPFCVISYDTTEQRLRVLEKQAK